MVRFLRNIVTSLWIRIWGIDATISVEAQATPVADYIVTETGDKIVTDEGDYMITEGTVSPEGVQRVVKRSALTLSMGISMGTGRR